MITTIVNRLKPLYVPLLKISIQPPGLPEGTSPVKVLKPSQRYLSYQYLGACLAAIAHLWPAVAITIAAAVTLGPLGLLVGLIAFLISFMILGFQLVVARIDWELRYYVIGERSLRVREGAWLNREVTLSYANVQNVEVVQGPIERLFGFQSLRVTTAGGGSAAGGNQSRHGANLVGIEAAEELRQLILERMKHHKDSGLGDLDEHARAAARLPVSALSEERLREVLEAVKALRAAAESKA
jgi:membrane protein YdbS with pleckstrin-like domain